MNLAYYMLLIINLVSQELADAEAIIIAFGPDKLALIINKLDIVGPGEGTIDVKDVLTNDIVPAPGIQVAVRVPAVDAVEPLKAVYSINAPRYEDVGIEYTVVVPAFTTVGTVVNKTGAVKLPNVIVLSALASNTGIPEISLTDNKLLERSSITVSN